MRPPRSPLHHLLPCSSVPVCLPSVSLHLPCLPPTFVTVAGKPSLPYSRSSTLSLFANPRRSEAFWQGCPQRHQATVSEKPSQKELTFSQPSSEAEQRAGKQRGLIRSMCPLSSRCLPCQSVYLSAHLLTVCSSVSISVCHPSICPTIHLPLFPSA